MRDTSELDGATIKCVIWDLDDTLWEGILTEDDALRWGEELHARFCATGRNWLMFIAYRSVGLEGSANTDGISTLRWRGRPLPEFPRHVQVEVRECLR